MPPRPPALGQLLFQTRPAGWRPSGSGGTPRSRLNQWNTSQTIMVGQGRSCSSVCWCCGPNRKWCAVSSSSDGQPPPTPSRWRFLYLAPHCAPSKEGQTLQGEVGVPLCSAEANDHLFCLGGSTSSPKSAHLLECHPQTESVTKSAKCMGLSMQPCGIPTSRMRVEEVCLPILTCCGRSGWKSITHECSEEPKSGSSNLLTRFVVHK